MTGQGCHDDDLQERNQDRSRFQDSSDILRQQRQSFHRSVVRDHIGVVEVRGEHELDGNRTLATLTMLLAGDRERERADVGEPMRHSIEVSAQERVK